MSDTRWSCRYLAVDAVYSTFGAVLATLEEIVDGEDRSRATEAIGILMQVHTFKFLLSLFWRILSCTKSLSDQLQSREIDLAKAADLVLATVSTLQEMRNDSQWDHIFTYVKDAAVLHSIHVDLPRPCCRKQLPRKLQDGVVFESTGARFIFTSDHFKNTLYLPVLDTMLSELQRRFSDKNLKHMRAVQAFSPNSAHFLDASHLGTLADSYSLDKSTLVMECSLARGVMAVLRELSPLKTAFPLLIKLIQIALTIAVSTASCERSFSALFSIYAVL